MELTHFSDETTVPEVGKQRFVNVLDKVYGRSMLVIGNIAGLVPLRNKM